MSLGDVVAKNKMCTSGKFVSMVAAAVLGRY